MSSYAIIVIGITSSLAGRFLSQLPKQCVTTYGLVRPVQSNSHHLKVEYRDTVRSRENIVFVDYDGTDKDLSEKMNCLLDDNQSSKVLYLSTKISLDILRQLRSRKVQTLAIGSGATTDWGNGRDGFDIVELAQNENTRGFAEYIEGKARAERVATVTVHPGFYLPDDICPFTFSGLHMDSCEQIFGNKFNKQFNWGKDKFVTPMGDLTDLIQKWVDSGDSLHARGGYSYGTDCAYPRWKLRELSGFNDVPQHIKEKYPFDESENRYSDNMKTTVKTFGVEQSAIKDACVAARRWVENNQNNYKRFRTP